MDYVNIMRITEGDFDQIIDSLGGKRLTQDESRQEKENADYLLNDVIIELKIIEEEPTRKLAKQNKLAHLFESDADTVVIDPEVLDERGKREYYRILESPIKNHVKKAARQLKSSQANLNLKGPRVAILINNGLYAHTREEFESTSLKCVSNDTSAIDILIVGGIYYYSDTFDMYTFTHITPYYINGKFDCKEIKAIEHAWGEFVNNYMTRVVIDTHVERTKEPIKDICFEKGGVRYVKPAPRLGPSKFWVRTPRPRIDTTGIQVCPPVGRIIPRFSRAGFERAMDSICDKQMLQGTYAQYNNWITTEIGRTKDPFCPVIDVELSPDDCSKTSYSELCELAASRFDNIVRELCERSIEFSDSHISLKYVLVVSKEIGIDKINDVAWISVVSEIPGFERKIDILNGKRLKFEYALILGSAYAVLYRCPQVYHIRDQKYMWF